MENQARNGWKEISLIITIMFIILKDKVAYSQQSNNGGRS